MYENNKYNFKDDIKDNVKNITKELKVRRKIAENLKMWAVFIISALDNFTPAAN